jgi:hypothetical protein
MPFMVLEYVIWSSHAMVVSASTSTAFFVRLQDEPTTKSTNTSAPEILNEFFILESNMRIIVQQSL